MPLPEISELTDALEARFNDPEKRLLLAAIAADSVRVASIALIDPAKAETEALFIKAQLSNFTAAEQHVVTGMVASWLMRVVFTAISVA